ncbi:MAG: CRTAC1 family protein, partial [Verrucomicrobiota bacterium]|nr:CRTAC1 family protein [Verrucomicrobiota bacterium]
ENNFKFESKGQGGVFYQESYSSPAAADYNNDGNLDLFFTTVYGVASFGRKNNPVLFRNDGDFKFSNVNAESKLEGLGATYQAAWADFDNDGDQDLMTAGRFFVNDSDNKNHWLKVHLKSEKKKVNRHAIGAQARVTLKDGKVLSRQVESGTGQGNQNDLVLHFGLGSNDRPVDLAIFWPDGSTQNIKEVQIDQKLEFKIKD